MVPEFWTNFADGFPSEQRRVCDPSFPACCNHAVNIFYLPSRNRQRLNCSSAFAVLSSKEVPSPIRHVEFLSRRANGEDGKMRPARILVALLISWLRLTPSATPQASKALWHFGKDHKDFLACLNCTDASQDSVCNELGEYGSARPIFGAN